MTRLIDADALRDKLQEEIDKAIPPFDDVIGSIRCGVRLARNIVEDEPTIDAVPVIRCKDCKWYYRGGATCMFWDGANGMCGDDFCGKAERAEE